MKKIVTFFFMTFMVFIISGMETSEDNYNKNAVSELSSKDGRERWKELKKKYGNSYRYTLSEESFSGVGSETTIDVVKGKVVRRHYIAYTISQETGQKEIIHSYEENSKKEIGSNPEGAPALNMDRLYKTCFKDYLKVDPDSNKVYFETNEEGVMTLCGYVPAGCQDDCFKGIRISYFKWR